MSSQTMEVKRAGARVFGIIFQLLALLVIVGTFVTADKVAHSGSNVGVDVAHDPFVWAVVASGLFAACVLAGFSYVLGMLCAIYDRQMQGAAPILAPTDSEPRYPPIQAPPKIENPPAGPSIKETATWQFLTRERHVRKSNDD